MKMTNVAGLVSRPGSGEAPLLSNIQRRAASYGKGRGTRDRDQTEQRMSGTGLGFHWALWGQEAEVGPGPITLGGCQFPRILRSSTPHVAPSY